MSNRKHFTLNSVKSQIIGTKTSLKKAQYPGSSEYDELCKLMEAHPQFEVVAKEVKRSTGKKTYKNLSYDFIEKYISIRRDSDAIMKEYAQVKKGQIVEVSEIKTKYEQAVGHRIGGSQIYYVLGRHGWRKVMPPCLSLSLALREKFEF